MRDFLHFTLYGPMAAWGEAAVGDLRPTAARPTRSALIGMIAACLGIPRTEEQALLDLERGLGVAVRVDRDGSLMRDYHTIQAPEGTRARDLPTRRDELAYKKVGTSLTYREYRTDAVYTVAVWRRDDGPCPDLEAIEEALTRPRFVPFLGRKSCPLAHPLAPRRAQAADLASLFATIDEAEPARELARGARSKKAEVFWDGDDDEGLDRLGTQPRHDALTSRARWQFAKRQEHRARVDLPHHEEP